MITKIKAVLKLAVAALLSFTIAPLCAAQSPFDILSQDTDSSEQYMGFTEPGQASVIPKKVISENAKGNDLTFSLDLYFGSDANTRNQPVRGIAPLIVYNSEQIKVVGISKPVRAGLLRPVSSKLKKYISDYTPVTPPALTTVGGESFTADVNKSLALTWLDRNGIAAVSNATPEQPVRVATIKFRWIPGAKDKGNSHIGITHSEFSVAHIRGASIKVQGPVVRASVSAQPTSIVVPARVRAKTGPIPITVKCSLMHRVSAETTCTLGAVSDPLGAPLPSAIDQKIKDKKIRIPKGKTSASKTFKIKLSGADSGRKFKITLKSAVSDGKEFGLSITPTPEIPLKSPAVVISKPGTDPEEIAEEITVEEGATGKLQVRLATPPNGDVVVSAHTYFHTTLPNVAIFSPASLVFTAKNWDQPQTVRVSSADDKIIDGNRSIRVGFGVDYTKSRATNYRNARAASVHATIAENDEADLAVTVKPKNILAAGAHPITITATLKGGGVFRTAKEVDLDLKTSGSADENAHYVPPTLPTKIIIPERAASARTAFTLRLARATPGAIVVGATFEGAPVVIPDPRVLIGEFTWDVDADDRVTTTDLALIYRYMHDEHRERMFENLHITTSREEIIANIQRGERVLNVTGLRTEDGHSSIEIADTNDRVLGRYFLLRAPDPLFLSGLDLPRDAATVRAHIQAYLP